MSDPLTPLTSRFATRIHRLTVLLAPGHGTRTIDLLAPVDPDALLADPVVEQRYKADNYMPYWPIIWPSGLMLAARILTENTSPPLLPETKIEKMGGQMGGQKSKIPMCIDLGCGLGLAGIAAALRGWHVTFTDYDPEAVQFAAHNAQRNAIPPERIRALFMDWRDPVAETFPWVLASDVLYEPPPPSPGPGCRRQTARPGWRRLAQRPHPHRRRRLPPGRRRTRLPRANPLSGRRKFQWRQTSGATVHPAPQINPLPPPPPLASPPPSLLLRHVARISTTARTKDNAEMPTSPCHR